MNTVVEEAAPAKQGGARKLIREVKKHTRKHFSAEEKIRIVLEGFRKEVPVTDLCRIEGIACSKYYSWTKDFMEAGKARLQGDTLRNATEGNVKGLKQENAQLKELLANYALENQLLKKSLNG